MTSCPRWSQSDKADRTTTCANNRDLVRKSPKALLPPAAPSDHLHENHITATTAHNTSAMKVDSRSFS